MRELHNRERERERERESLEFALALRKEGFFINEQHGLEVLYNKKQSLFEVVKRLVRVKI